jgi:hypothetical protein
MNNNVGNGNSDAIHLFTMSSRPELKKRGSQWYQYATEVYFPKLQERSAHFEPIFSLEPTDFISEKKGQVTLFDIEKLKDGTKCFRKSHEKIYESFINGLVSLE